MAQFGRLALHTWTVDTTPLGDGAGRGARRRLRRRRAAPHRLQALLRPGACRTARCSTSSARRRFRSARSAANTAGCSPRAKRARACSTCWRRPARTRSRSTARRSCARPGPIGGTTKRRDREPQARRRHLRQVRPHARDRVQLAARGDQLDRGAARDPQRRRPAERRHAARRLSPGAQRRRRTRLRRRRAGRVHRVPVLATRRPRRSRTASSGRPTGCRRGRASCAGTRCCSSSPRRATTAT